MFDITVEPGSAVDYDVIVLLNEVAKTQGYGEVSVDYQAIIRSESRAALATPDVIRQLYRRRKPTTGSTSPRASSAGRQRLRRHGDRHHPRRGPPGRDLRGHRRRGHQLGGDPGGGVAQGAEMIDRWPNMTPQEKADFMGRVAAEVIAGLPAKARQAGRIGEAAQDAARSIWTRRTSASASSSRPAAPSTASAATELVKRMERLGATTVNDHRHRRRHRRPRAVRHRRRRLALPLRSRDHGRAALKRRRVGEIINKLTSLAQTLGATTDAEIAHLAVLSSRVSLRTIGEGLWDTRAGLRYGPDPNPTIQNRVRHVLRHAVDDPSRPGAHGVFDAGTRGTLQVIDEGWTIALGDGCVMITQNGFRTAYDVDMETRIGFVGGQAGAAAGFPEATHLCIVIKNLRDVVTAFPVETQCYLERKRRASQDQR